MITDLAKLNAQVRLQNRRVLEDWLKQRVSLEGFSEMVTDLDCATLKTAMTEADSAAKSAVGNKRYAAHLKATHAAALYRDMKYALAGRTFHMALAAHDAMLRCYRGGVESEKVGGVS